MVVCDECVWACSASCEKVAPGVQPRWAAFQVAFQNVGEPQSSAMNAEFMIWIGRQWRVWLRGRGRPSDSPKSEDDHIRFDEWLWRRVGIGLQLDT